MFPLDIAIKWCLILCSFLLTLAHGFPNSNLLPADNLIRLKKAQEMLKYMNQSVDPCDDFYEFACGNWPTYYPAHNHQVETGPTQVFQKSYEQELSSILSSYNINDSATERKMKAFYQSCMKLPNMEEVTLHKIRELIGEFGEMPVLVGDSWREDKFDWLSTVARIIYKYDISIILAISTGLDFDDVVRLTIGHHKLVKEPLSTYFDKDKKNILDNYKKYMTFQMITFLGVDRHLAYQTAQELLDFEIALARGVANGTTDGGELQRSTSVQEMQIDYGSELDIEKFFQIAMGKVPSDIIVELNPDYQERLIETLRTTPKRVVANYIFYQLVVPFMMDNFKVPSTLQHNCMLKTKTYFEDVLDNFNYRRVDIRQTEREVINLFHDLKNIFKSRLSSDRYSWMSKSSRKYALEKLQAMKIEIKSYTDVNFAEKYQNLNISDSEYTGNLRSIFEQIAIKARSEISLARRLARLHGPRYVLTDNKVYIPVSVLQPQYLWSPSYPLSVNFGPIGLYLGHEIIHGFDSEGVLFGKNGELLEWLDSPALKVFKERVDCFKRQFGNYTYYGKSFGGMESQSENISDSSGMQLLGNLYRQWYNSPWGPQSNPNSEMLPHLNYSGNQLLYLSYAQSWCYDSIPLYRKIKEDEHAPYPLRVIGTLSNTEDFAEAFKCPKGSPMNPVKKCEIY